MSLERRIQEIELLRKKYGLVEHGQNSDWLLFKEFPLPSGWNRQNTELLIVIPPGYPATPPDNFYVQNGFRLQDGRTAGGYSENQSICGGSWGQFSYHAQSWNPCADFRDGDSLFTFIFSIEQRLHELN